MRRIKLAAAVATFVWLMPPRGAQAGPGVTPEGDLSLRQALALTLRHGPDLAAYAWEIRAREAEALQAGKLPNPELEAEVENVGGRGDLSGVDGAETTVSLSQLVELGGKRGGRRHVAELEARLAGWDYEAARLDALTGTTLRFVAVLAAQERLSQAGELHALAERLLDAVRDRVEAGKVSPIEESRARVPLAAARIDLEQARTALESARRQLAASWGSEEPTFSRAVGSLEDTAPVPTREALIAHLPQSPEIARWETELRAQGARVDLERARAVPDLTLFAGGRHLAETGDAAFVAGVSITLPVFDRNQGGIAAAQARQNRAEESARSARLAARRRLDEAHLALQSAAHAASLLQSQVLPAAETSLEATLEGYRFGKLGLLDVLDAQRNLFEARGRYLESLHAYHRARAEVERLTGSALPLPPAPNTPDRG